MTHDLLTAADHSAPEQRFVADPDFALPLGDVHAHSPDLVATGLGLLGHGTPLPLALADALAARPDPLLDDLHHQRITTLVSGLRTTDIARTLDGHDPWSQRLAALTGLAHLSPEPSPASRDLSPEPAPASRDLSPETSPASRDLSPGTSTASASHASAALTALRLAPIFAAPDRTPASLALLIQRLLGRTGPAPALRCQPAPARLTPLDAAGHTRLGAPTARLAATAALGTAIRLPGSAARLHLGAVPPAALPDIRALIAAFLPEPLALEFVVDRPPTATILGRFRLGRA
ncbi:MAG: type VI secretion system baseplate subunit TssG [Myxococcales bacterium]|nr:type VI secretion system baseplate subunit TssG [Myxococcales bacterium]